MKTLLIDNHDSFTYNLYQYMAAVNGQLPLVVRNDEMTWNQLQQLDFDNIVISPGPGRPQRAGDLGLSGDAIREARVPILGVCLGHQAIAHFCGATVGLAIQPMHGRIDSIWHVGHDLFEGLPDRFRAVRYHSLAVTDLPPELQATAWCDDGTLMAFRHTALPRWGVQFHPESICTEHGRRLLRNFHESSQRWLASGSRWSAPRSTGAMPLQPRRMTLHAQPLDGFPDPEAMFGALFAHSDPAFWLDSSMVEPGRSRFSYMGDARGPCSEWVRYRTAGRQLLVHRHGVTEQRQQSIFDYLSTQMATPAPVLVGDAPGFDFVGGYVGYFGYELKGELDGDASHDAATPDAVWLRADRFLAFDHLQRRAWAVCLDDAVLALANAEWVRKVHAASASVAGDLPSFDRAAAALGPLTWRHSLAEHGRLIERCQEEIRQGESYEVCLTNQSGAQGRVDAFGVYRALRRRNPAPYAAYFRCGDLAVLCASPELFLRISADGTVESKPIKGTAARACDPAEDAARARSLAADEKSRAENLMIVDLLRNDLNRVCEVGSVHVPGLFQVESYATVHQLVSTIRGRLRDSLGAVDCVKATFPGGSMTGAPKVRTLSILDRLEHGPRGVYSGSLGFLSFDGAAQLNIVIRTIVATADGVAMGTGGAILALSSAADEVEEIVLKLRAQLDALRACGAPWAEDVGHG